MGWNKTSGAVTRSFDDWKLVEKDIQTFLTLSETWMKEKYTQAWNDPGAEPVSAYQTEFGEPEDQIDSFTRRSQGLDPGEYFWMLHSAVLKDAVTAFEVFLEKNFEELLDCFTTETQTVPRGAIKFVVQKHRVSPSWGNLAKAFGALGVDIETTAVKRIRSLRHILTHQRGEIRTLTQWKQYTEHIAQKSDKTPDKRWLGNVDLTLENTLEMMAQLGEVARSADAVVYDHVFGSKQLPQSFGNLVKGKNPVLSIIEN